MLLFSKRAGTVGIVFAAVVAASVLASCAAPNDLSAIQRYASITAQSGTSFAALAADFAASCERYRTLYLGIVQTDAASQQVATLITDDPKVDAFVIPNVSPQPGYIAPPPQGTSDTTSASSGSTSATPLATANPMDCATAGKISVSWGNANAVVLNYVQALGNLAGVDAVPTANPSPLVSGLEAAGVSGAATQAIGNLIKEISNYVFESRRNGEITKFLADVNPTFPTAVEALEQVDGFYSTRLDNEYRDTINQYNIYAQSLYYYPPKQNGRTLSRRQVAANLLRVRTAVQAALVATNQRLRACADYGAAMQTILATHQQLYEQSQKGATFADFLNVIQTTGAPVVTNLTDLAKAVK
ncbi:MAG: hypothetical protein WA215_06005 [Candidatus Cybelea sp.]